MLIGHWTNQQSSLILSQDIRQIQIVALSKISWKQGLAYFKMGLVNRKDNKFKEAMVCFRQSFNILMNVHNEAQQGFVIRILTVLSHILIQFYQNNENEQFNKSYKDLLKLITTKEHLRHCSSIIFKTPSLYSLVKYDTDSNIQYQYDQLTQAYFWIVVGFTKMISNRSNKQQLRNIYLQALKKCGDNDNNLKNYIQNQLKKITDYNQKLFKRQQNLIQKLSLEFLKKERFFQGKTKQHQFNYLRFSQIPIYAHKALKLAIKGRKFKNQNANQIQKMISLENNNYILQKLAKTQFYRKAIKNYQNSINIIQQTIKKYLNYLYKKSLSRIRKKIKKGIQQSNIKQYKQCLKGHYITKINYNNNDRVIKYLWIKDKQICWAKKQAEKDQSYSSYKLKNVLGLTYGKVTDNLVEEDHNNLEPWKCFSLVCQDRTLDFYCDNPKDILFWLPGISYHIKKYINPNFSNYSIGRILWKMILIKSIPFPLKHHHHKKFKIQILFLKKVINNKNSLLKSQKQN